MRKTVTVWLLFFLMAPGASGDVCTTRTLPSALSEETVAYLASVSTLENPVTEGPWLDLYVSPEESGHYPLGNNSNSGEDPSEPLKNFTGLQFKLNSLSNRCGVRINLDYADDFSGTDVNSLRLSPTCADPDSLGIWVRSSLPGVQVQVDCTGWSGFRALFGFVDSGNGDGGWSAVENVHVVWCDEDLFSALSGSASHGLVLNSGGTASGASQILTAHSARGGTSGNEIVAINSYGIGLGGAVPIQPGGFGRITAVGRGTFASKGNSVYGSHGTVNVIGHYFTDGPEPPSQGNRRMFNHRPASSSSNQTFDLMLVNVGVRTESESRNSAFYSYNSGCQASENLLRAKLFKVTVSGWSDGVGGFSGAYCPESEVRFEDSACLDFSDNGSMFRLNGDLTSDEVDLDIINSIWDDEPGGNYSWAYNGIYYQTRAEFEAASGFGFTNIMSDSASYESGGPGVDGTSFASNVGADPPAGLPGNGSNPDSTAILPVPGKEAYQSCETRFQAFLDPAIPAFVTRLGIEIKYVDMNRCGGANIGYQ